MLYFSGVTDTKELIVSKYSKNGCTCVQTCEQPLLCIAYGEFIDSYHGMGLRGTGLKVR